MTTPLSIPPLDTPLNEYITLLKTQTDVVSSNSKKLPDDIPFHRSLDRKFRTELDATSARILRLTNKLLKLSDTLHKPNSKAAEKSKRVESDDDKTLEDEADVVDKFHSIVVDVVDPLLEHVDYCLDIHTGRLKLSNEKVARPEVSNPQIGNVQKGTRLPQQILHSANLPKPQLKFLDAVDNSDGAQWRPRLKKKWHTSSTADTLAKSSHPYLYEIQNIQYPATLFTSRPSIPPNSFEDTPLTHVDTVEGLGQMLENLRQSEEIAVDLEYHSYRSYYGFVCLMQISNRNEDWIVDCLVPEVREALEDLNEVFTNPNIVKVFHGAESDIHWLQQNFSLYIVGLFDTFHASRALDLPRHSLAFLLSAYCDFQADKRYQLADWRIRPLPEEMLHYARSDTHFLLFVYDQLREALLEKGKSRSSSPAEPMEVGSETKTEHVIKDETTFVRKVLKDSEVTSLNIYAKESYDAEKGEGMRGWANLLKKWNKRMLMVDGVPRSVYLAIHAWRDQVGREEDESPLFVLSNQLLLNLVERPVPQDLLGLYSSFPGVVPPLVRKRGNELLKVMQSAASKAQAISTDDSVASKTRRTLIERKEEDVQMVDVAKTRHTVFSTQAVPVPGLWNSAGTSLNIFDTPKPAESTISSMVAKASSLFGNVLQQARASPSPSEQKPATNRAKLSSKTSALFSNTVPDVAPTIQKQNSSSMNPNNVQTAIAKIHEGILKGEKKTVVIQKQSPKKEATTSVAITTTVVDQPPLENPKVDTNVSDATVPAVIAFVPRPQRQSTEQDNDEVIVVGQRKKKRKRVEGESTEEGRKKKAKGTDLQSNLIADAAENDAETAEEVTMFDYSTARNILDDNEEVEEDSKKKRKKRDDRGNKLDFRGFGPTPKRTNEPKSGNKSLTFR